MKSLLIVLALSSIAFNSHAACEITLKSKTATTAGAKIGDVSFSKKQLEALAKVCTVKRDLFSTDELIALEKIAFDKKINKLKGIK